MYRSHPLHARACRFSRNAINSLLEIVFVILICKLTIQSCRFNHIKDFGITTMLT